MKVLSRIVARFPEDKFNEKLINLIVGFIPSSEGDVRYFGEDVPGVSQSFSEDQTFSYQDEEGTITVLGSPIKFDPPNLNFKEKPIGVPGLHKVTIHNINSHSSIQMLSISGNTIHFHCSFFEDKVSQYSSNTDSN